MKKLLFVFTFFVLCNAYAAAPKSEVQPLIDKWGEVYPLCKGNPHEKEGRINCNQVDEIYDQLEAKGWCYQGPTKDSPTAAYRFRVCRDNTYEEMIAIYTYQWESARDECLNKKSFQTEQDQKYSCEDKIFYENHLKKRGWCLIEKTDTWSTCPPTERNQLVPSLVNHWKVLIEKCPQGYDTKNKYCSKLPAVEAELKKAGYCLKRKPTPSETALWDECQ